MPAVLASWLACLKMEVDANVALFFRCANKLRDFLLRCRVATAFFVRTLPLMVADGAGIEIVFICRFVSIVGRKKERLPSPVAYKSTKHIEVRFRFRERQPKAVYNIRVRAVLRV